MVLAWTGVGVGMGIGGGEGGGKGGEGRCVVAGLEGGSEARFSGMRMVM